MLPPDQRLAFAGDYGAGNVDVQDVFAAGHVVHYVEHQPLEQAAQSARAGPLFDRLHGQLTQRVL